jgi:hypothetical protein
VGYSAGGLLFHQRLTTSDKRLNCLDFSSPVDILNSYQKAVYVIMSDERNYMPNIFGEIERLITEHGSASILRERLELAKEQYAALEKKNSDLQGENKTLRQKVDQFQEEIETLKQRLGSQTDSPSDFDEDAHKILKAFFNHPGDISLDEVAVSVGIDGAMAKYHFDLLIEADFITQTRTEFKGWRSSTPALYSITAKGRKYVVKNNI